MFICNRNRKNRSEVLIINKNKTKKTKPKKKTQEKSEIDNCLHDGKLSKFENFLVFSKFQNQNGPFCEKIIFFLCQYTLAYFPLISNLWMI